MSATPSPSVVWFRKDLRLTDQPALSAAIDRGGPIVPLYIWAPDEEDPWRPGGAAMWWLYRALADLKLSLEGLGLDLIIRRGPSLEALRAVVAETAAGAVYWNRRYEPAVIQRDTQIKQALKDDGLQARSLQGHLLYDPGEVLTQQGKPYTVFTMFWKGMNKIAEPEKPLSAPEPEQKLPAPPSWPQSLSVADLGLNPKVRWDEGLEAFWEVGEHAAHRRLEAFLDHDGVRRYDELRDRPDLDGTSRLSPYLAHGQISPRSVWHAVRSRISRGMNQASADNAWAYLREIGWREFSYHLMYFFPRLPDESWKQQFHDFPWRQDEDDLKRWQRGATGYPIVDAGMRQLWRIGWVHNRVRMIVSSFLTKHLRLHWLEGARWYWDTLVDADLADNSQGWQWAAGSGADAAPYFRVFNPILQGEKFDPRGQYTKHWCPELAELPGKLLQKPWEVPPEALRQAGVKLGESYPQRIVEHKQARQAALEAFETIKKG